MDEQHNAIANDSRLPILNDQSEANVSSGMSYKFQRLREKLRSAIVSGELSGKLPGERLLAKQFNVNAKTLSKALTDLAAEGMLDRSIGRGTYVKGSEPAAPTQGRWLVIADEIEAESSLIHAFRSINSELQIVTSVTDLRPSFLNQFVAAIDTASNTSEAFLRDLLVRNMLVVCTNREPRNYSTHSVFLDMPLAVSRLARDLLLAGHRRFAAVEPVGEMGIDAVLRQSIARYAIDASVDTCFSGDLASLIDSGVTAIICGSAATAIQIKAELENIGVDLPDQVSLAAVGCTGDRAPCSGFYCSAAEIAEAAADLLRNGAGTRPTALWLAGTYHNLGTTGQSATVSIEEETAARSEGVLV